MQPESKLIYIVDDSVAVLDSLETLLTSAGYQVRSFASGSAFLGGFNPSDAHCVLLDIILDDSNGLDLLDRICEQAAGVPVIVMTGYGTVPRAVRAMKAGAADFIEKPFDEDQIFSAIARARDLFKNHKKGTCADETVQARIDTLTPREHEVLEHLVIGRSNKQIAHELGISPRTVEIHRSRVMKKMHAESLSHLVRMILSAGELLDINLD